MSVLRARVRGGLRRKYLSAHSPIAPSRFPPLRYRAGRGGNHRGWVGACRREVERCPRPTSQKLPPVRRVNTAGYYRRQLPRSRFQSSRLPQGSSAIRLPEDAGSSSAQDTQSVVSGITSKRRLGIGLPQASQVRELADAVPLGSSIAIPKPLHRWQRKVGDLDGCRRRHSASVDASTEPRRWQDLQTTG